MSTQAEKKPSRVWHSWVGAALTFVCLLPFIRHSGYGQYLAFVGLMLAAGSMFWYWLEDGTKTGLLVMAVAVLVAVIGFIVYLNSDHGKVTSYGSGSPSVTTTTNKPSYPYSAPTATAPAPSTLHEDQGEDSTWSGDSVALAINVKYYGSLITAKNTICSPKSVDTNGVGEWWCNFEAHGDPYQDQVVVTYHDGSWMFVNFPA